MSVFLASICTWDFSEDPLYPKNGPELCVEYGKQEKPASISHLHIATRASDRGLWKWLNFTVFLFGLSNARHAIGVSFFVGSSHIWSAGDHPEGQEGGDTISPSALGPWVSDGAILGVYEMGGGKRGGRNLGVQDKTLFSREGTYSYFDDHRQTIWECTDFFLPKERKKEAEPRSIGAFLDQKNAK